MRLGVSYNIFDGEELLEGSIKQIRSEVDYISVVYQTISNFGNKCNEELIPLLNRLKSEGLVDELYEYKPKIENGGHYNEIVKRNIIQHFHYTECGKITAKMLHNSEFSPFFDF